MTPTQTPDCNRDARASFAAPMGSAFTVRDELTRLIKRTNEADPGRTDSRVQGYRDALLLCRRLVRKEFRL